MNIQALIQRYKNFFWLAASEGLARLVLIVIAVLIARRFTIEEAGVFQFLLTVIGMCGIVADFGSSGIFLREASQAQRQQHVFFHFVLMKLLFVFVFGLLATVIWLATASTDAVRDLIPYYSMYIAIDTLTLFIGLFFRARQLFALEAIVKMLSKIFLLGCVIGGFYYRPQLDLTAVVLLYVWAAIASFGVAAMLLLRSFTGLQQPVEWDRPYFISQLTQVTLLGISTLLWQIYYRIDAVLLRSFTGDAAVALYVNAYNFFQIANTVPALLVASFYPQLSQLVTDLPALKHQMKKILRVLLLIGIIGLILAWIAAPLLPVLFGPSYVDTIPLIRILFLVFPVLCCTHLFTNVLVILYTTRTVLWISAVGVVVNIALNLWLIPGFGIFAAATTTIITECIIFLCAVLVVRRLLHRLAAGSPLT
jgi:PST family polysaccharide transporter